MQNDTEKPAKNRREAVSSSSDFMASKKDQIADLVRFLRKQGPVVLLESQKSDHPASNTSYLAARPEAWVKSRGNDVVTWNGEEERREKMNPWIALDNFKTSNQDWLFGYLGYDLKNHIEELYSENPSKTSAPDMFFMVPGLLIEVSRNGDLRVLKGELPGSFEVEEYSTEISIKSRSSIQKSDYLDKVKSAQKSIMEGDFYEVNLSHVLEFSFSGDGFELYRKMKAFGPVPFASFIEVDGASICCSSPERFLSRKGSKVWSQPIKGTWSRSGEPGDDGAFLLQSEKNRAENLMIVDLVRNDLSRVARKGTVEVKNLFEIQSFETVHQMVSTVECEVDEDIDSVDIIKACFPMGSMTGAPKISAMKAIEMLENYKRGIYSGAIGYITPEQDFDFNVVIRTAIIEGKKLVYPVGGAITSDSIPGEEWEETLVKARALTLTID